MRTSQLYFPTLKETPADAEIISHQLLLRAGMIRRLSSGLYTWLPLGVRVLKNVEKIVREEMQNIGAQEIFMPAVQPAELWQESGRWNDYGSLLLKIKDSQDREYCFGPTHEEIVTDLIRHELRSYKQLPVALFQIQIKFRDEIRPRFGLMRAREFLMKDAYSFHLNRQSLQETYQKMYQAYSTIFTRLGLNFRAVLADTGNIGGSASHEFQVLANSGEDLIFYSDESDYAANIELAESLAPPDKRPAPSKNLEKVLTPGKRTIAEVSEFLKIDAKQNIKAMLVKGKDVPVIALFLRGDHELNFIKAEKLPEVLTPLTMADEKDIEQAIGCPTGYIGPVNVKIPSIVDRDAAHLADFTCGANEANYHLINVNWDRDVALPKVADIRKVVVGDKSPDGKGHLQMLRGIEVGHIFQLGNKYSSTMNAKVIDEQGQNVMLEMGCYGIGVSRIVAAAIEQHHDKRGIIWPINMAPFQIALVPINYHRSETVRIAADNLFQQLKDAGFSVLFDDRNERPGVMFADMELIGIPHRLVISERGLAAQTLEYQGRCDDISQTIAQTEILNFLQERLEKLLNK